MDDDTDAPPIPAPRAGISTWLIRLAFAGIALDAAVGIGLWLAGRPVRLSILLAVFLLSAALLKFTVAVDALRRMRSVDNGGPGPDPSGMHGTRVMATGWIVYKFVVGVAWVAAAAYVFTAGAAKVDTLFTGR